MQQESQGKAQESVEMVEKVQQKHEEESEKAEEDVPSEEEDISTALSKEIDALKAESKKSLKERKFQVPFNYFSSCHNNEETEKEKEKEITRIFASIA